MDIMLETRGVDASSSDAKEDPILRRDQMGILPNRVKLEQIMQKYSKQLQRARETNCLGHRDGPDQGQLSASLHNDQEKDTSEAMVTNFTSDDNKGPIKSSIEGALHTSDTEKKEFCIRESSGPIKSREDGTLSVDSYKNLIRLANRKIGSKAHPLSKTSLKPSRGGTRENEAHQRTNQEQTKEDRATNCPDETSKSLSSPMPAVSCERVYIEELVEKLREATAEISRLEEDRRIEKFNSKKTLAQLREECAAKERNIQGLEIDIRSLVEANKALETNQRESRYIEAVLKRRCAAAEEQVRDVRRELKEANRDRALLEQELQDVRKNLCMEGHTPERQLQKREQVIREWEHAVDVRERALESQSIVSALKGEISQLTCTDRESKAQIKDLNAQLTKARADQKAERESATRLANTLEKVTNKLVHQRNHYPKIVEMFERLKEDEYGWRTKLEMQRDQIEKIYANMKKLTGLDVLRKERESFLEKKVEELEHQNRELKAAIDERTSQEKASSMERVKLTEELAQHEASMKTLQRQFRNLITMDKYNSVVAKLGESERSCVLYQRQLQSLKKDVSEKDALSKELATVSSYLSHERSSVAKAKAILTSLYTQLLRTREELSQKELEETRLRKCLENAEDQVNTLVALLAEYNKQQKAQMQDDKLFCSGCPPSSLSSTSYRSVNLDAKRGACCESVDNESKGAFASGVSGVLSAQARTAFDRAWFENLKTGPPRNLSENPDNTPAGNSLERDKEDEDEARSLPAGLFDWTFMSTDEGAIEAQTENHKMNSDSSLFAFDSYGGERNIQSNRCQGEGSITGFFTGSK